jgi:hypothetical protein
MADRIGREIPERHRPDCPHGCVNCTVCARSEWWAETLRLRAERDRLRALLHEGARAAALCRFPDPGWIARVDAALEGRDG